MFYEERVYEGCVYFRTDPKGRWTPVRRNRSDGTWQARIPLLHRAGE